MGTRKRKERRKQARTGGVLAKLGSFSAKQVQFLAAYATCGLIGRAAKISGCDRSSHGHWMRTDPDYPAKFADAQAAANEMLEAEARRRATQGVERMKFYKGEPIIDPRTGKPYIEHEYSDRLLELALKAHMPDKYVDRQEIKTREVTGDVIPPQSESLMKDPAVIEALLAAERKQEATIRDGTAKP